MSLQQEIDAFISEAAGRFSPDVLTKLRQSIEDVRNSGIAERALTVGDLAPAFTLPNAQGRPVALTELLRRGPVIVCFYRGIWCPYCNLELRAYQRILPEFAPPAANSSQSRRKPPTIPSRRRRRTPSRSKY